MNLTAINIALIPECSVSQRIIDWNKGLHVSANQIQLGLHRYLPHITLAMQVVDTSTLPDITKAVNNIKDLPRIKGAGIKTFKRESDALNHLLVEPIVDLLQLRTSVQMILPAHQHLANADCFYERVQQSTSDYVNDFQAGGRIEFEPHITLGYGEYRDVLDVECFNVRLGVFHIGNHCTCAEEFKLPT